MSRNELIEATVHLIVCIDEGDKIVGRFDSFYCLIV
jgi:hypothetical protein